MKKIGLTGATGFIGKRLIELAVERGDEMVGFSRRADHEIPGCVETRLFSQSALDVSGLDAVIHLAGENVFGLWTQQKKDRIRLSRVEGTRAVVEAIQRTPHPPAVLVSSSAIGFYGDTGDRSVDEDSEAGSGFLAEVAAEWEAEALKARTVDTRVAVVRTGVVLGAGGGALKMMVPVFRLGGGGELGDGQQWMSWIHLDDIALLYLHAVDHEQISGPLNGVAPENVRNTQFTDTLAQAVRRPALFRVPAWLIRTALGGFSAELLESKRVEPKRTAESGYAFRFPQLYGALLASLGGSEE